MNNNLLKLQSNLQQQAQQVLKKLKLIELLSKYGRPNIVGSMELGLMTWRDIDIEVIVKDSNKEFIAEIVATLIRMLLRRIDFGLVDNRGEFNNPKTPKGIYLGLKYFPEDLKPEEIFGVNEKVWKIDIHFVLSKDSQAIQMTKELASKLTEEKKKAILEIKKEVTKSPKHRKEIFTIDVYNAVLYQGVKNINEFKDYLREKGINL